jgi:ABC-2 type transport system permease protein
MTVLMPIGILLLMVLPLLMTFVKSGTTSIAILDESGLFVNNIDGNSQIKISFLGGSFEDNKESFVSSYDGFLHIPQFNLQYDPGIRLYTEKQIGLSASTYLERRLERIIENERFKAADIDKDLVERLRSRIRIESIVITGEEEKVGNDFISLAIGFMFGFVQYFMIFIYGSMIMKSVIDEKKNRIVEILVSSLKPFELMICKILGIASVAITQLVIWFIFIGIIFAFFSVGVLPFIEGSYVDGEIPAELQNSTSMQIMRFAENPGEMMNIPLLIFMFSFYFVFGYLFYSTLYAGVGSLSDDDTQAQSFILPISMLVILCVSVSMNIVENPHSPLAFWVSILPFSSPICMLVRIPFQVPYWQVSLSMFILVVSFLFATWLSGKIYRTGILLYGKKLTWKDLWKFVRV